MEKSHSFWAMFSGTTNTAPQQLGVNTMQHLLAVQSNVLVTPYPYAIKPPSTVPLPVLQVKQEEKTRKRKREEEVTFVQVPRDDLLKMSSTQLEEYFDKLKRQRPFTEAEQREVKRQRRLIKNREYAHTSRLKKKELVQTMKEDIDDVKEENYSLHAQVTELTDLVEALKARNAALEEENKQLKAMSRVGDSPAPRSPTSPSVEETSTTDTGFDLIDTTSDILEFTPVESYMIEEVKNEQVEVEDWLNANPFTTSAGIFLMALFFSFALFLNPSMIGTSVSPRIPVGLAPIDQPFVEVAPAVSSTGRHLCGVSDSPKLLYLPENTSHRTLAGVISMSDVLSDEMTYSAPNMTTLDDYHFDFHEPSTSEFQSFPPRIAVDA